MKKDESQDLSKLIMRKARFLLQLRTTTIALCTIILFIWATYTPVWALYQDEEKTDKITANVEVVDIKLTDDKNQALAAINAKLLPVPGIKGGDEGLAEIDKQLDLLSASALPTTSLSDVVLYKIIRVSNASDNPVIVQMHDVIPSVAGTKLGDHLHFAIAYMKGSQLVAMTFNGSELTNNVGIPDFQAVNNPFANLKQNDVSFPEPGMMEVTGTDKSRFISLGAKQTFDVRLYAWLSEEATLSDVFADYEPNITTADTYTGANASPDGAYNFEISFSAVPKEAVELSIGKEFDIWNLEP